MIPQIETKFQFLVSVLDRKNFSCRFLTGLTRLSGFSVNPVGDSLPVGVVEPTSEFFTAENVQDAEKTQKSLRTV
jgi:hypothetical protein